MKKFLFIIAACSSLAAIFFLSGCAPDDSKFKECFEKWQACNQVCNDMARKAADDYSECLKQAREKMEKGKADCDMRFPKKDANWAECFQNVMNTYSADQAACAEAYKKAMEEVDKCRQDCYDEFKRCAGWE